MRSDYGTVQNTLAVSSILKRVVIDKNKNVCTYGGSKITQNASTFNSGCPLLLLTNNYQGSPAGESLASAKIYSCQGYDNGTLVRDYVPCINASGKGGMYDLANKSFEGNAGTGDFVVGPKVDNIAVGDFIEEVKSVNSNAYPDGGVQDGYYYERVV